MGVLSESDLVDRRLVVIKNAKIVGIITRHDILNALTRSDAELQVVIADVLAARDLDVVDVNVKVEGPGLVGTVRECVIAIRSAGRCRAEPAGSVAGSVP